MELLGVGILAVCAICLVVTIEAVRSVRTRPVWEQRRPEKEPVLEPIAPPTRRFQLPERARTVRFTIPVGPLTAEANTTY